MTFHSDIQTPETCEHTDCNGPDCEGCRAFRPIPRKIYQVDINVERTIEFEVVAQNEKEAGEKALNEQGDKDVKELRESWDHSSIDNVQLIEEIEPFVADQKERLPGFEAMT